MPAVRRAQAGDAPALALAAQATFLETFAGLLDGPDVVAHCAREHSLAAYEAWLADPDVLLWLAEADQGGAPVGYALLAPPQLPVETSPTDLELKRIYLLSRFHGGGAGRQLMDAAIGAARERGCGRLLLGVYAGNQRALAFYAKTGFERIGERSFRVGGKGYEDIIFALDLRGGR